MGEEMASPAVVGVRNGTGFTIAYRRAVAGEPLAFYEPPAFLGCTSPWTRVLDVNNAFGVPSANEDRSRIYYSRL